MTVRCRKLHLTGGNSSKAMWNPPRRLLTLPAARLDDICWAHCSQNSTNASSHATTWVCREGSWVGLGLRLFLGLTHWDKCTESPSNALTALSEAWTSPRIGTIHLPKHSFFEIPLSTWEIQWHMNYGRTAPFCRGTWRPGCPRTSRRAVVAPEWATLLSLISPSYRTIKGIPPSSA